MVEEIEWNEMILVRISSVGEGFAKWLYGQTCPYVEDNENPTDWAYYWDYARYVNNLPIVD